VCLSVCLSLSSSSSVILATDSEVDVNCLRPCSSISANDYCVLQLCVGPNCRSSLILTDHFFDCLPWLLSAITRQKRLVLVISQLSSWIYVQTMTVCLSGCLYYTGLMAYQRIFGRSRLLASSALRRSCGCCTTSDVKYHEIFWRETSHEIFREIFLKHFKNFTMDYGGKAV